MLGWISHWVYWVYIASTLTTPITPICSHRAKSQWCLHPSLAVGGRLRFTTLLVMVSRHWVAWSSKDTLIESTNQLPTLCQPNRIPHLGPNHPIGWPWHPQPGCPGPTLAARPDDTPEVASTTCTRSCRAPAWRIWPKSFATHWRKPAPRRPRLDDTGATGGNQLPLAAFGSHSLRMDEDAFRKFES